MSKHPFRLNDLFESDEFAMASAMEELNFLREENLRLRRDNEVLIKQRDALLKKKK